MPPMSLSSTFTRLWLEAHVLSFPQFFFSWRSVVYLLHSSNIWPLPLLYVAEKSSSRSSSVIHYISDPSALSELLKWGRGEGMFAASRVGSLCKCNILSEPSLQISMGQNQSSEYTSCQQRPLISKVDTNYACLCSPSLQMTLYVPHVSRISAIYRLIKTFYLSFYSSTISYLFPKIPRM